MQLSSSLHLEFGYFRAHFLECDYLMVAAYTKYGK